MDSKSQQNIERVIEQVNGSMAIERMPLTLSDKIRIRECVGDDKKVIAAVRGLVKKHSVPKTKAL